MKKKTQLYIAYGSNLSVDQMAHRCPQATILGTGWLHDYKLEFRTHANVVPAMGEKVPVLVWNITEADRAALDRYEGFPAYYIRKTVPVEVSGETMEAMVYVMTDKKRRLPPSCSYLATILSGYAEFGFSPAPVAEALNDLELRW